MRLIYLGTPQFAVPPLEALLAASHEIALVVTQPDRPKGRGRHFAASPVKECALAYGLDIFQPERIRHPEAVELLRALHPEIMVVVGYGQIIPQSVIDLAPRGIVNVHASLLPHLRGAAPIQWAIARGDSGTGVSTMQIDAGLDTGDVLLKSATSIDPDETAVELSSRLSRLGAQLLIETLDGLAQNRIRPEKQDPALATYAPVLKKEDGRIDWARPAAHIHNLVRGMQPWPGGHTSFRGSLLHVWKSRPATDSAALAPGTLAIKHNRVFASCGDGQSLELLEVQLEGRKRISAADFLHGQRLAENERLGD